MKRNYVYAAALLILSLLLWLGIYVYMEYRPVVYKNGTLVELPEDIWEERELAA